MVVTSTSDEVPTAIDASTSDTSLRGLDAVNLLLAGVLSGFGPYVAVFLADQSWTQQNTGFVLTAAGFVGLLTQLPAGGLLDAVRSKRAAAAVGATLVAVAALIIAMWPSFPLVLAALALQAMTGGLLGLASRPSALAWSAMPRWASASAAISVLHLPEEFSRRASWGSSAISCRIAQSSSPPPRWCCRC
jgi:predicted MFS family arabinose efflux permease